ncbi:MAG: hypothetical protein A2Z96_03940, partial [Spirochaetes bacterium GWB1_48_6]
MSVHATDDLGKFLRELDDLVSKIDHDSSKKVFKTGPHNSLQDNLFDSDLLPGAINFCESIKDLDGRLDFTISEDLMSVVGTFYPPEGRGLPLIQDMVECLLSEKGVKAGINWPYVKMALTESSLEYKIAHDVLIAQGVNPVNYKPEGWELLPDLLKKKIELDEKALFIDFKTISPFIFLKKGDLLTQFSPSQLGYHGYNVRGDELPSKKTDPKYPKPGENVVLSPEGHRADCDGCFELKAGEFSVKKLLVLNEGISYKTGNIDFDGDLQINGEVNPGFTIKAKGSLFTKTPLNVTEIQVEGDLISNSGLIGRKGALLKSENRVVGKFLESITVKSKGSVEVQSSVMGSTIQTLDKLIMGTKGILLGSHVHAQNGVDCFQIGSERGAKSEIVCGMDFTAMDKILWIRDKNTELTAAMRALKFKIFNDPQHEQALNDAYEKLNDQTQKLTAIALELVNNIDRNENAEILVRGTIFPGNYLEICHYSFVVPRPMSRVRFRLDKKLGIISHES